MFLELGYEKGSDTWQNPDSWLADDPGYQLMSENDHINRAVDD